ncbi:PREDICTED: synaptonemal complex protein 2 [Condylura cristata]|uniref:synaptonemal complex protein 2 n=1 Tax=Condylura cristata TaxID=143302 RepID=UPI000642BDE4|nr:PREDICTED: synaptonemal complex protein 2 [Condylura cristata]
MPIRPDLQQFEKCIDDALRKNDFKPLKALLQIDIYEDVKVKCSKQFFHKLDDLVCRELSKKDVQTVSTILISFGRCGRNLSILGQAGLLTMIEQGLVHKMVTWFEKSKEIILSQGNSKDETVINMVEDLFDLLMVIHDVSDEGKRQVMENFIPRICALVIDSRVNICIQQETLKKMNAMLDKMPQEARKILSNQEMLILMSNMGERILEAGDYDLQVGIVEALCRMTTEKQRHELACHWFSMDFIADAFRGIKDSEFETDCRIFLNLVNGMLGDKRRVFTFPCLSAFLGKYELQIPSDDKLEDFWIDFNLGSQTLSFYIAGDNDDHQWEAVTVPEEKVQAYSIEVRESKKLLTVILKNVVKISKREGKELLLYFDASLEITNVTQKVFGASKYRGTPTKRKMSEASMIVPGSERYTVRSPVLSVNTSTPRRGRIKPPLPMRPEKPGAPDTSQHTGANAAPLVSRASEGRTKGDKADKHVKAAPIVEKTENKDKECPSQNLNELQGLVPGSQAMDKTDKPALPGVLDKVCGNKMNTKLACWTPVTNIKLCSDQQASPSSGVTCNQDMINKKPIKQVSSSISDNSEETEKLPYRKEIMQCKKVGKVEVCGSSRDRRAASKQQDWRVESQTAFRSVRLNRTVEESLIYRKKYILSRDVNTAARAASPSRNSAKANGRPRRQPAAAPGAWDLRRERKREKSKEEGFTGAADSLIKQINNRYKPKEDMKSTGKFKETLTDGGFSNKPDLPLSKEKVQKKSYRQLKTTFVNVTSECPLDDVYNFNLNGADEPTIKLGIQEFQATATEACVDDSIKLVGLRNYEAETYRKTKDKRIITNQQKKNLFSDTDTEYIGDDSKTDISWLRESKSKPQLVDYSRNKKVKKHKTRRASSSLERRPGLKTTCRKNITRNIDETIPDGRTRLPRRATTTRKNYKDLSTSESESEAEFSHSFKKKLVVKVKHRSRLAAISGSLSENSHSRSSTRKQPEKQQSAFSGGAWKEAAAGWSSAVRDQRRDAAAVPLSGSPSSVEVMRCVEKIAEKDLSPDSDCIARSLSPCPQTSPESLCGQYRGGGPGGSPRNSEKNVCAGESTSSAPQSDLLRPSRKRTHPGGHLSNSDEADLEEVKRIHLLPRSLSKAKDADLHADKMSESTSPLSLNDFSTPVEKWGGEISEVGMMCQKINTELQRKCNNRQKIVEYFSKHTWKMVRHHVKTINHQIQEYRIKKLDKFQFTIIEELENFERDSQSLKDLEKEFVDLWEKIFQKFKTYQKGDQQRLHLLKASLDKNVFFNTDYEETIFTSEMCLMKEDMKVIQNKFLKEMQEEELLNVRRGLLTLFLAHETEMGV